MARHAKEKRSKIRAFPIPILRTVILMVIIVVLVYKAMIVPDGQHLPGENAEVPEENAEDKNGWAQSIDMEPDYYVSISSDSLHSPYAILIRLDNNTVLMDKKSQEKIYPASLTKIMTAIVAIENLPDLHKEIELTNYTFDGLYSANASMAGFQPGEKVRVIDLLYGVMLPSGAEACIALADEIAGSKQDFVGMMNQKAADLGMNNTNFTNAVGLHHKDHYTTVEDLAVLLNYALQNDTFREIFTSECHTTLSTNKHPDGITLFSTMFKEISDPSIIGGEILGGKTGYTKEAGLCLASLAKKDGKEYILITAGAEGDRNSEQYNIADAFAVYNSLEKE
jgi:D-alanyl-D-alanine carboxypeptidase (penicillin-binding protein 5/6)